MKPRFTEESWKKEPHLVALIAALHSCKTHEDLTNLVGDIATLGELQDMSERLEVARLLGRGLSYRQVAKETGASTTTVTRVAKVLENGNGGYRKILQAHRHHDVRKKIAAVESSPADIKQSVSAVQSPLQKYLDKRS